MVVYLVWFRRLLVVVSDTSCFFSTSLNSLASSLSMKATKELLKKGKKETKIPFRFQFFGVAYDYSVARNIRKHLHPQTKR